MPDVAMLIDGGYLNDILRNESGDARIHYRALVEQIIGQLGRLVLLRA